MVPGSIGFQQHVQALTGFFGGQLRRSQRHAAWRWPHLQPAQLQAQMQGYQDVYMELSWMSMGLVVLAFLLSKNRLKSRSATSSSAPSRPLRNGSRCFREAIHPDVAPVNDEIIVTKHRVSAFHGTDLEMILRAKEIDTLLLFGIATSGVVLSTLLNASDTDYRLIVVKDCCFDLDADVHACLIEKVFPRRATVLSADELREALNSN
jgi:hypothetical protein